MMSVQNRAAYRVWLAALAGTLSLVAVSLVASQPASAQDTASTAQQQPAQPAPGGQAAPPAPPPVPEEIAKLPDLVRAFVAAQQREERERAARFQRRLEEQRERTRAMTARRNRAQAETDRLDEEWNRNEALFLELSERLELQQGNLGELFGVTRQVAGDASTTLGSSLITSQIKTPEGKLERSEFLRDIAGREALPDSNELRQLWYEILREIVESGKVVRYTAPVAVRDASAEGKDFSQLSEEEVAALPVEEREVVRVGPFMAVTDGGEYLGYLPSGKVLTELDGHLAAPFRAIGRELMAASPTDGYTMAVVDPSSGGLLGLYLKRPNWFQRIEQGEVVGWVIVAVGVLGVAVALIQAIYLVLTRLAVSQQLRNLNDPKPNNPLGRVLLAFRGDGSRSSESAELAELRLSEAVLREIPRLERFQAFLRLAVAAGPLLGLIGTVIGMIITFKAITASGSSDPKLMAQGIGQAMIATVLGLGIAIPLLFINSGLAAMSRSITQILDEQSHSLLADRGSEAA